MHSNETRNITAIITICTEFEHIFLCMLYSLLR